MAVPSTSMDGGVSGTGPSIRNSATSHDQFMQLMLRELTQQDPLKPMSTSELAQQMLALEQVKSSENLQTKLETLSHSLMVSAGHLIGRNVSVLHPQTQQPVSGVVQALRSRSGEFQVVIDGQTYAGESITEIR